MKKANECKTAKISEDDLLKLIAEKSKSKGVDAWAHMGGSAGIQKKWGGLLDSDEPPPPQTQPAGTQATATQAATAAVSSAPAPPAPPPDAHKLASMSEEEAAKRQEERKRRRDELAEAPVPPEGSTGGAALLWADKYAPTKLSEMVGVGAKVKELQEWLSGWERRHQLSMTGQLKRGSGPGDWKAAVLVSGPPGIGKTTSAHLVCKEVGYDFVEFNASDHRSAGSLRTAVSAACGSSSIVTMFQPQAERKRVVVVMDEVDGCDHGGVGEVIKMIKMTRTPIICLCNDRYHPKLRSLAGHCLDLTFSRPPKNVVSGYLRNLLRKHEGVELNEVALQEMYEKENNDLRSTFNNLQMLCRSRSDFSTYGSLKDAVTRTTLKNIDMSPFQAAQEMFGKGVRMGWEEIQRLCFDNDLLELFMQENYIYSGAQMGADRINTMARVSRSLSTSDRMEKLIRSEQKWTLAPAKIFFSCYDPLRSLGNSRLHPFNPHIRLPCFPSYMGKMSTTRKQDRLLLCTAKQASATQMQCGLREVATDYLPSLRVRVEHAQGEDVEAACGVLVDYGMMKEDWDFAQDITFYKSLRHRPTPIPVTDAKTKSALTRLLNKNTDRGLADIRRQRMGAPTQTETQQDDDSGSEKEEKEGTPAAPRPQAKAAASGGAKRRKGADSAGPPGQKRRRPQSAP